MLKLKRIAIANDMDAEWNQLYCHREVEIFELILKVFVLFDYIFQKVHFHLSNMIKKKSFRFLFPNINQQGFSSLVIQAHDELFENGNDLSLFFSIYESISDFAFPLFTWVMNRNSEKCAKDTL